MQIRLDRSLPIALTEQIKSQIIYAVSTGLLSVGSRLPSVRELSGDLKVAPMTISQTYRELVHEGVILTRAGAGTFVADISGVDALRAASASRENLHQIIESAVRQAFVLGYTPDDIRQAFLDHATSHSGDGRMRCVGLVGNFQAVTESYAWEIETILGDLNVQVQPVLLCDLKAQLPDMADKLQGTRLIVAVPTRLQEVRTLLEPHGCRVVAVAFRVCADARRQLAEISPAQRVGVLATYPEFLPTMIDEVGSYCLARMPPPYALLGQDERIRELLTQIDILVYASGSEAVLASVPETVRAIELRHSPDPDSVRRLRPFLV